MKPVPGHETVTNHSKERSVNVLVAPDKFKGTLTGAEAASAIARGVASAMPRAQIRTAVIADGGEGTLDAAIAAGARSAHTEVTGPMGTAIMAPWARFGSTAVIELAAASGLQLLTPTVGTALESHTESTGRLMLAALDADCEELLIGLGGSASTDGGAGALRALGVRFLDSSGRPVQGGGGDLHRIVDVDFTNLDRRLGSTPVTVLGDVKAPLLGPLGAATVFGPQKGADAATVARLEDGLANLADRLRAATGRDMATVDGAGAAGGVAGGLYAALGARFELGIDRIAELIGLEGHLAWADIVVIGEGSFDRQSLRGKGPFGVLRRAKAKGLHVVAVAGRIALAEHELEVAGLDAWAAAVTIAPSPSAAMGSEAAHWVTRAAAKAVSALDTDRHRVERRPFTA